MKKFLTLLAFSVVLLISCSDDDDGALVINAIGCRTKRHLVLSSFHKRKTQGRPTKKGLLTCNHLFRKHW